jgi:hypothetical protein
MHRQHGEAAARAKAEKQALEIKRDAIHEALRGKAGWVGAARRRLSHAALMRAAPQGRSHSHSSCKAQRGTHRAAAERAAREAGACACGNGHVACVTADASTERRANAAGADDRSLPSGTRGGVAVPQRGGRRCVWHGAGVCATRSDPGRLDTPIAAQTSTSTTETVWRRPKWAPTRQSDCLPPGKPRWAAGRELCCQRTSGRRTKGRVLDAAIDTLEEELAGESSMAVKPRVTVTAPRSAC